MENLLLWVGRLGGLAGMLLCAVAAIGRITGIWTLGTFQIGTVFQAGMAAMLLACLAYSANVAERARR